MKILVLDDDVRRHGGFAKALLPDIVHHVYDFYRACAALRQHRFDLVYLDHDLNDFGKRSMEGGPSGRGGIELTGVDVCLYIAGLPADRRPKRVIVHTWNPDGGRAMVRALQGVVPVSYEPYQAPTCGACGKSLAEHSGNNRATMRCP